MSRNPKRRNPEPGADLALIGEIVKPHGIRGEVKVYPYSGQPENFNSYQEIVLRPEAPGGTDTRYRIVGSRVQGRLAILELEGVMSREAAEQLQGCRVWLPKSAFRRLGADEYYWHQLEGCEVRTETGQELGRVTGLFRTPAHDIMEVTGRGDEYLIPVRADIIHNIDEQAGRIIITPPAGLLEINK